MLIIYQWAYVDTKKSMTSRRYREQVVIAVQSMPRPLFPLEVGFTLKNSIIYLLMYHPNLHLAGVPNVLVKQQQHLHGMLSTDSFPLRCVVSESSWFSTSFTTLSAIVTTLRMWQISP